MLGNGNESTGDNVPPEGQPFGEAHSQGGAFSEQVRNDPVGARVPERIGQGVFATGTIVLEGQDEFVIDFVQGLARPARVASRVVVSGRVMSQFVGVLRENLQRYEAAFGPPKEMPRPPTDRRPSIHDIYRDLKMPEDVLSGVYATGVMISHSPGEFAFDFITRFFPTAAVSARVYLSASQVPRMLETLSTSLRHFLDRAAQRPSDPPRTPDENQGPESGNAGTP